MGQTVTTPLSLTLKHWSDVKIRANNEGVVIKKKKWITLCEADWVKMNVGWPRQGTFNLSLISQVEGKVFASSPQGHPDQVPYIAMWRLLTTEPPPWVKPFLFPSAPRQQQRSPNPGAEEARSADPSHSLFLPNPTPASLFLSPQAAAPAQATVGGGNAQAGAQATVGGGNAQAGAQATVGGGNAQAGAQATVGGGNAQAGAQAAAGYGAGAQAGPGMGSAGDCSPTGSGTTGEPRFGEGGSGGTAPLMSAKPLLPPASPSSSLYPVLPRKDSPKAPVLPPDPNSPLIDLLTEDPPPYPGNRAPEGPVAPAMAPEGPTAPPEAPEQPPRREREDEIPAPSPIAGRLRGKRDEPAKESRAFPLREGPNHQLQYWPFSASDLYNWKQHNPPFSKDPVALTNLIESILVTHKPTWEDCQQLLQTLLTVEEKQWVFLEARKRVPGEDGRPTQLPNIIDAAFPLTRPNWDFATPEGREHLRLYRQLLLAGLRGAARRPTNLAQVRNVTQGKEETPAAFLERLREAYRMYTPYDPEDTGQAPGVILSFIYQSSPDIRAKLQRLEGLHSLSLSDLLREAEKVFNKRETPEEREERLWQRQEERDKKRHREITKVLATVVSQGQVSEGVRKKDRRKPPLDKDQCAYCRERGHWARDCPKKPQESRKPKSRATDLLNLED
ncbi:uncharacterized protein LOC143269917 [Peromyscus maniculatus bairdii]|uniref:uncharacterized protein LOC143269917 n=1 Tax=Peromyscus maniculatus bairdii TaxID=230844 RepID=UPI003FD38C1D